MKRHSIAGIELYNKTLAFKRGITLDILLTVRCNLHCSFCSVDSAGRRPICPESTFDEWVEFFKFFPEPVREVSVSGGEPTLVGYCRHICNYLLRNGKHVALATNLTNIEPIKFIDRSHAFQVSATCHEDPAQFMLNVAKLRRVGYRVNVREIGARAIKGSLLIPEHSPEYLRTEVTKIIVAPDRSMYRNVWDLSRVLNGRRP